MAVDYGRVRVGIALSDTLQMTAQPYSTIENFPDIDRLISQIVDICTAMQVGGIVVGLPVNMDGTEGEMAQEVRLFADSLKSVISKPIMLLDERLTSIQARRLLQESGMKRRQAKSKVDQIAASLILRGYLDRY